MLATWHLHTAMQSMSPAVQPGVVREHTPCPLHGPWEALVPGQGSSMGAIVGAGVGDADVANRDGRGGCPGSSKAQVGPEESKGPQSHVGP